jgi:hypothetical protein
MKTTGIRRGLGLHSTEKGQHRCRAEPVSKMWRHFAAKIRPTVLVVGTGRICSKSDCQMYGDIASVKAQAVTKDLATVLLCNYDRTTPRREVLVSQGNCVNEHEYSLPLQR